MRMIREAKEIQDKMDELADRLERIEKTRENEHDISRICGWLQALIWVCRGDTSI